MGHLCNIFQVGKVKAEQLKRADGSVEVWSRWQRRLVQAPARGLHSVESTLMFSALSAIDCEQNSEKMSSTLFALNTVEVKSRAVETVTLQNWVDILLVLS